MSVSVAASTRLASLKASTHLTQIASHASSTQSVGRSRTCRRCEHSGSASGFRTRPSWRRSSLGPASRQSPSPGRRAPRSEPLAFAGCDRGEIRAIFTVDLFNEGVDIPEVDTVLMLRPTESSTIFLQQLGRGLRHSPGKSVLTVLDFIGQAHRSYRYDVRYPRTGRRNAETGRIRGRGGVSADAAGLRDPTRSDSNLLRPGQHQVEPWTGRRALVEDLKALPPSTTLAEFIDRSGHDLDEIYANPASGTRSRILGRGLVSSNRCRRWTRSSAQSGERCTSTMTSGLAPWIDWLERGSSPPSASHGVTRRSSPAHAVCRDRPTRPSGQRAGCRVRRAVGIAAPR